MPHVQPSALVSTEKSGATLETHWGAWPAVTAMDTREALGVKNVFMTPLLETPVAHRALMLACQRGKQQECKDSQVEPRTTQGPEQRSTTWSTPG